MRVLQLLSNNRETVTALQNNTEYCSPLIKSIFSASKAVFIHKKIQTKKHKIYICFQSNKHFSVIKSYNVFSYFINSLIIFITSAFVDILVPSYFLSFVILLQFKHFFYFMRHLKAKIKNS